MMGRSIPIAWTLAAVIALAVSAGDGIANPNPLAKPKHPEARKKLDEGNRYYDLKDYDRAIEAYKAGYVLSPDPVFLYNLGQANRFLKRYDDAIGYYENFLARGQPTGDLRMYVEDFIRVMRDAKQQEEAARTRPPTDPEPGASPPAVMREDRRTDAPGLVSPWYADPWGWALAGAGVVTALTGTGFLFNAASLSEDAKNEPDRVERERLRDLAGSRRALGIGLTVAGAAVLTVGVIKLAATPGPARPARRVYVGFGAGSVVIGGIF